MNLRIASCSLAVSVALSAAALNAAAATTIEAESMALSSYAVENGNRIKLTASSGTATKTFSGTSGTYDIQVYVIAETDGQSTLEVYKGSTLLRSYTYPLSSSGTSFTISNVSLTSGQTLKLLGRANAGAVARVDKVVLLPKTTTTTTTTTTSTSSSSTIEAESMSLASYAVENGNRIKLTASTGTATKSFSGASGTYNMQVYVIPETDGQSKLEVYKGATLLRSYTYPLSSTATSFTIGNVSLTSGQTLKLLGRANAGAIARVDKIVLTPATTTSAPAPAPSTSTTACANPSGGYQGFGRYTTGGAGKPVYRVTNRNNSGAGSLRDALSQGNRCVVFDVGGTITLSSNLLVRGANVTIDGLTAPSPGITLKGGALSIQGTNGAGNVVVRGLRSRSAPGDAISIYNASNVVVDRVSVSGYGDGAIDVTEKSRNVTIQWSILGNANSSSRSFLNLIAYGSTRITSHHNLYINGDDRHPYCGVSDSATSSPSEVVCDVRNNVMWNFRTGTTLQDYGNANVVNNYYYSTRSDASHTIWNDGTAKTYISGNVSKNGYHINGTTRSTPFSCDAVTTTDALSAAKEVKAKAGARGPKFGLDSIDQGFLGQVSL